MKKKSESAIALALFAVVTLSLVLFAVDVARFPESYITTTKYHLMEDLNNGDADAVEYYHDRYISHGRVLFDGSVSFNMVCYEYGLNKEETANLWCEKRDENSKYESLQEFVDDFVK